MRHSPSPFLFLLVAGTANASLFGEENGPLSVLVAQGAAEIAQLTSTLENAQQQLQLARDVYAGVNEFINFDPESFLSEQQAYWTAQVPLAGDAEAFVRDVSNRGLNGGHFNTRTIYARLDAYGDAARVAQATAGAGGARKLTPYDPTRALSASDETQAALANPSLRKQLLAKPEPSSATEGLLEADAARVDPALLELYLRRRAIAQKAEEAALKLYKDSIDASPGKAQQIAAMASAKSTAELARVNDTLAQQLTIEQVRRQEEAVGRASERRESDFLWGDTVQAIETTFAPPTRGPLDYSDIPGGGPK